MMLRKDFGLEVKSADDAGVIEGYGSTFDGEPDSYGDIVLRGAFSDSITKHKAAGTMPLMLWGHESYSPPIGNWTDMGEDRNGLWMKGQIDLEDPMGQRVHRALARKSVRGLSIGYRTIESRNDPKRRGVNLLEKLELLEVSVVNFPANTAANVTAVKEFEDLRIKLAGGDRLTEREWEQLLKSGLRLSNAQAERAVRKNFNGQGEPAANGQGEPGETDQIHEFWKAMAGEGR